MKIRISIKSYNFDLNKYFYTKYNLHETFFAASKHLKLMIKSGYIFASFFKLFVLHKENSLLIIINSTE